MKGDSYLIKAPPQMLARWREEAEHRGVSLAQLIRETMNHELERAQRDEGRVAARPS